MLAQAIHAKDHIYILTLKNKQIYRKDMTNMIYRNMLHYFLVGMKTDRIRTDITDIIFVFTFLVGFGFEYG